MKTIKVFQVLILIICAIASTIAFSMEKSDRPLETIGSKKNGFSNLSWEEAAKEQDAVPIVYVTQTGEKYHRKYCSHLMKRTTTIRLKEAESQGYKACSRCKKHLDKEKERDANPIVYITKTGERYHSRSCSHLKKKTFEMRLSQAESQGYAACSRCEPE